MTETLIIFPKEPINLEKITYCRQSPPESTDDISDTHHEEVFEYDDGSYVVLVLPKTHEFTLERIIFMAERLKRAVFDEFDDYAEDGDDEGQAPVDHPPHAS